MLRLMWIAREFAQARVCYQAAMQIGCQPGRSCCVGQRVQSTAWIACVLLTRNGKKLPPGCKKSPRRWTAVQVLVPAS